MPPEARIFVGPPATLKMLYLTVIYSDTIDRIILTPYNTTSKLTEPLGETNPNRKYSLL